MKMRFLAMSDPTRTGKSTRAKYKRKANRISDYRWDRNLIASDAAKPYEASDVRCPPELTWEVLVLQRALHPHV